MKKPYSKPSSHVFTFQSQDMYMVSTSNGAYIGGEADPNNLDPWD